MFPAVYGSGHEPHSTRSNLHHGLLTEVGSGGHWSARPQPGKTYLKFNPGRTGVPSLVSLLAPHNCIADRHSWSNDCDIPNVQCDGGPYIAQMLRERRWGVYTMPASILVSLLLTACAMAVEYPRPNRFVNDLANQLPPEAVQSLEKKLRDYQRATGNEIRVAVVSMPDGMSIDEYSEGMFRAWGGGGGTVRVGAQRAADSDPGRAAI